MKHRGWKIALICLVVAALLVTGGLLIYFNFFQKTTYRLTGVEKTDYTVADFADQSELKLYDNGTFHVQIIHQEKGLSLIGIGTYQLDDKTYQLNFVQAYARDTNNTIIDITEQSATISCTRSGNRIKLIDHKSQIYYFG